MKRVRIRFSEDFCGEESCNLCFADIDSKEIPKQETVADYAMTYEEFLRNRMELAARNYRQELQIPRTYYGMSRASKRRKRFKSNQLAVRVDENSPVAPEVTLESLLMKPFVPKEEIKAQYEGSITPPVENQMRMISEIVLGIDWGYEDEIKIKR